MEIGTELFNTLKGFGYLIELYTEDGNGPIANPDLAAYIYAKDKASQDSIMLRLPEDDANEYAEVVIYKSEGIDDKLKKLLMTIKNIAISYGSTVTIREFGKSIEPKDLAHLPQAKQEMEMSAMNEGGMPSGVIRDKQKLAQMNDEELAEYLKDKTEDEVMRRQRTHALKNNRYLNVWKKYHTNLNENYYLEPNDENSRIIVNTSGREVGCLNNMSENDWVLYLPNSRANKMTFVSPEAALSFLNTKLREDVVPFPSNKKWFSTGSGRIELEISPEDAESCSHSGDCEDSVLALMDKPYIKNQLERINPEYLKEELKEYGAWDEDELDDFEKNQMRILWLACCDISEQPDRVNEGDVVAFPSKKAAPTIKNRKTSPEIEDQKLNVFRTYVVAAYKKICAEYKKNYPNGSNRPLRKSSIHKFLLQQKELMDSFEDFEEIIGHDEKYDYETLLDDVIRLLKEKSGVNVVNEGDILNFPVKAKAKAKAQVDGDAEDRCLDCNGCGYMSNHGEYDGKCPMCSGTGKEHITEGKAHDLLKAEMPLVRHIEKELAGYGYQKGTDEYKKMFDSSLAFYRKFANVDQINKEYKSNMAKKLDEDVVTFKSKKSAEEKFGKAWEKQNNDTHRHGVGTIPCKYCDDVNCDFECDGSQGDIDNLYEGAKYHRYGTTRSSYHVNPKAKNARVIIRHSKKVIGEGSKSARSRNVKSLYVESLNGERRLIETKSLMIARAIANHINGGGDLFDDVSNKILALSEDIKKIRNLKKKYPVSEDESNVKMHNSFNSILEGLTDFVKELNSSKISTLVEALNLSEPHVTFAKTFYEDKLGPEYKEMAEALARGSVLYTRTRRFMPK